MSIRCHFSDSKALLVTSLTPESSATTKYLNLYLSLETQSFSGRKILWRGSYEAEVALALKKC